MASRELNILIKAKNLASSTLKGIKGEFKGLGKIGSKAGHNLATNFERGVIAAGAGVAGFTGLAIKTAADFEDAFAGVQKTVDETQLAAAGLSFEGLLDDFRAMAREMPITFEELAAIGEAAGALGIAAGDITEFTDVVAKLGVTTDLTSDAAATALGHLGTILGLTGDDFEELADSLVALGNDGASTESQIIGVAERFAAAGRQAGLTKEDILALSSTATSMGVDVEAAGSSLSRLFNNTTTNIGLANDKADAFADALGLTFDEFKKAWDTDALGTFQDLLDHLNELDQFEAASLLKDIGINNTRDINAIQLLSGGVEELADQLETARKAQGALNEEAGKKFATTASQFERFKNIVRDTGFVIGRELLPIVNDLMTDFANFMAKDENQAKIKQFAKDFAANVREAVEWLRSLDWGQIADTMGTVAGFGKSLLEAFLGMPSWVQVAVTSGWGLNKLTGGAVGDLLGLGIKGAAKGAFGALRGSTPANPVFTKEVGGVPGAPGAGGKGGGGGIGPLGAAGLAGAALTGITIAGTEIDKNLNPTGHSFREVAGQHAGVPRVRVEGDMLKLSQDMGVDLEILQKRAIPLLEDGNHSWEEVVSELRTGIPRITAEQSAAAVSITRGTQLQTDMQARFASEAQSADRVMLGHAITQGQRLADIQGIEGGNAARLDTIAAKDPRVTVSPIINTQVNISLQEWQRVHISSLRARSNSGGFV